MLRVKFGPGVMAVGFLLDADLLSVGDNEVIAAAANDRDILLTLPREGQLVGSFKRFMKARGQDPAEIDFG